jgi:hypothetical protein
VKIRGKQKSARCDGNLAPGKLRSGAVVTMEGSPRLLPRRQYIVATPSMSISDTLAGPYQASVGVGAFCSMRFCRFSSAQNSAGIVACMELTLARTCASVCAPTINTAATSGAAEN